MHDRNHDDARRNMTAEEEAELNDNWHPIGHDCPECRPDLADDIARHARGEEAA